ncbi:hypothetical protein TNCV_2206351 [Trichonephila clavipes]|uniref:Uncharacterized protein n=1 Tax=Trichonephila clavipes TaxID=2585209 RepID=A0A8X6S1M6_TRICX|nr:hypothetical protein TNCV_2206351 [Trichonephila clavipes]
MVSGKGRSIDSHVYSDMLVLVDAAIKAKRRTEFHPDNAKANVSAFTDSTRLTSFVQPTLQPQYNTFQLRLHSSIQHRTSEMTVALFLD